jgi:hypothetical protein
MGGKSCFCSTKKLNGVTPIQGRYKKESRSGSRAAVVMQEEYDEESLYKEDKVFIIGRAGEPVKAIGEIICAQKIVFVEVPGFEPI